MTPWLHRTGLAPDTMKNVHFRVRDFLQNDIQNFVIQLSIP